ncbi:GntR family transcriptional regulator [Leifsonia shinshuensis]
MNTLQAMRAEPDASAGSADMVYEALRRKFSNGELAPAERLTEAALAEELGVSRTPIREAIGRLRADGLVVGAAKGVAVATLSGDEVRQLYVLRARLEGLAAELAAQRQSRGELAPKEVRLIREAAESVAAAPTPRAAAMANLALHRAIGRSAGNPMLLDALGRVWDRIAVSTVSNLSDSAWMQVVEQQHDEVISAIEDGRPEVARAAAEQHIDAALEQYLRTH